MLLALANVTAAESLANAPRKRLRNVASKAAVFVYDVAALVADVAALEAELDASEALAEAVDAEFAAFVA